MRMLIRLSVCFLFITFGLSTVGTLAANAADQKSRPNIIFIMADDLGVEGLNCYGGTSYRTPRLDKMATQGMRFTQAYAQPLCTNTRIQVMTGLYNHRNWLYFGCLDPKAKTFGHLLQQAGYRTCLAGKWQLHSYDPPDYPGADERRSKGMKVSDAGFDQYSAWHTGHTEDKGPRYADPVIDQNGTIRSDTQGKYGEDLWVEFITQFIDESAKQEQPFFVYYPMALPHWPFVPTPHSKEWGIEEEMHPPLGTTGGNNKYFPDMVAYMDEVVGRILDAVDDRGLAEETLIIYYADNGTDRKIISRTSFGNVEGGKGLTTQAGIHVPLIVRWPGTVEPGINDNLVDSTDLLPTMLAAAGASIPSKLDGISFFPQLLGQKGNPRTWSFCHYDPRPGWDKEQFTEQQFVHDGQFKLYKTGALYNVESDPLEQHPLSDRQVPRGLRHHFKQIFAQVLQELP